MQQVKVFIGIESEKSALEKEINSWLAETNARVVSICGNIAPQTPAKELAPSTAGGRNFMPSDLFVLILFETD